MEKIRWAARVSREKIWKLYQSDAQGILDEELLEDVGFRLLARIESIFLITEGKVQCPRCGAVFVVRQRYTKGSMEAENCPTEDCGWQVTGKEYDQSIRHRELGIGQAEAAFAAYRNTYPQAKSPEARMFAIDRLIHAFHWDAKLQLPNRPAANNLIEGSLEQVIDLLDRLTYGSESQAAQAQVEWRETLALMQKRRRGQI